MQQALQTVYGYNAGGFGSSQPVVDEKFFGKLTWQINDKHRFVFIGQSTAGSTFNQPASNNTTLGLDSTTYLFTQPLESYSGYLYSATGRRTSRRRSPTPTATTDGITDNIGAPFPNFQDLPERRRGQRAPIHPRGSGHLAPGEQPADDQPTCSASRATTRCRAHTRSPPVTSAISSMSSTCSCRMRSGTYQFTSIANLQNRRRDPVHLRQRGVQQLQ